MPPKALAVALATIVGGARKRWFTNRRARRSGRPRSLGVVELIASVRLPDDLRYPVLFPSKNL